MKKQNKNWESRVRQILANVREEDKARKVINLIRQLLAKKEKEAMEEIETIIRQYSAALPIEIERFGGEYCQGMHAGIDLCIDAIIKLKRLRKKE